MPPHCHTALLPAVLWPRLSTTPAALDAAGPGRARLELGLDRVPLLCARAIDVPGSLPMIIRVLVHFHADPELEVRHVYLGAASVLRADLDSAQ